MRIAGVRHQTRILNHQQHSSIGRRHGSRAPGPLEARRRASKRKYAAPATVSTQSTIGDPGALLAFDPLHVNSAGRQYEGRKFLDRGPASTSIRPLLSHDLESPAREPSLPSWLTTALSILKKDETLAEPTSSVKPVSSERWRTALSDCGSVEDIDAAAVRFGVQLSDPSYSREAFARYVELCRPHEEVIEYLSDRTRNPSGAHNVSCFLATLARRSHCLNTDTNATQNAAKLARRGLRRLRRWISTEIQLGSITEDEIRHYLQLVTKLQQSTRIQPEIYWRQISSVVYGLQSSRIVPLHQADPSTIQQLLRSIALSTDICLKTRGSLAREVIIGASLERNELCYTFVQSFIAGFSSRFKAKDQSFSSGSVKVVFKSTPFQGKLSPFQSLTEKVLRNEAAKPLESLFQKHWLTSCVQRSSNNSSPVSLAKTKLTGTDVQLLLAAASDETILTFLEALEPNSAAQLFDAYFKHEASMAVPDPAQYLRSSHLRYSRKELPRDVPVSIDALPHDYRLTYIRLRARVYARRQNPLHLKNLLQSCRDEGNPLPIFALTELVNDLARTRPSRALTLFLAARNLRIEYCAPLVAAMIASPTISNATIMPLLQWSLRPPQDKIDGAADHQRMLVPFLHQLAAMLSHANVGSARGRAKLVSGVLELFDARPDLVKPGLLMSVIKAEVRNYLALGIPIDGETKMAILEKVENYCQTRAWALSTIEEETVLQAAKNTVTK